MAVSQMLHRVAVSAPSDQTPSRADLAGATLRAFGALLALDGSETCLAAMFDTLTAVFNAHQALALEPSDDGWRCIGATHDLPDSNWANDDLHRALDGEVLIAGGGDAALPLLLPELLAPNQPALCFPIGIGGRRAVVLLLRALGAMPFGEDDAAAARQCAVVTLAALAARSGSKLAGEVERLNALVEELRRRQGEAEQDRHLLRSVIDVLPSGVTVEDEQGELLLANAAAAAQLANSRDRPCGAEPEDQNIASTPGGPLRTFEQTVGDGAAARVWLTAQQRLRVGDRIVLVSNSHDITARKRFEEELTQRAYFDELTGLPNRLLIQGHVQDVLHHLGPGRRFALAFIDLDNFKHINDYYSHAIGDALLVKVTERIAHRLRETDVLSRISGDEFLLVLNPLDDDEQVRTIINHLINDLKQPFYVESFEIFTSASIGVSFYPEHGNSYEALRRNADNAMYRAKAGTKGGAIYFNAAMGKSITARMEHEQRLRLAIRDRRFCCAFQPKVDIHTEEVVGFETLVRWRDDDGEIHPPSTFIGLAVELGVIDPITHFMLAETIKSMERLDDTFGATTTFSINVAAKQAGDVKFMRSFADAIKASNRAERIMVEVTEEAFVAKGLFQTQVLPMLRDIGVRVSIDDFGTGYSSLSVLSEITADELKVDRSFITDIHRRPRSQSILRTIESLGHSLGMSIVAEGIETYEELAYLHAATRIRHAQGFYFSKPFFLNEASGKRLIGDGREPEPTRETHSRRRLRLRGGAAEK